MRRPDNTEQDTPSYDSFLDIVANLVGILVILIMVLGVRAQEAWQHSAHASPTSVPASPAETGAPNELAPAAVEEEPLVMPDVEGPKNQADALRRSAHEIEQQIATLDRQTALQKAQRDQLQLALTIQEREAAEREQELAAADQVRARTERQLRTAREALANLQQQVQSVDDSVPEPIVLPHRPAPLAQTVFGREEHFRLHAGRLSYVPMTELVEQLKDEAKSKSWKLKEAPAITETIGPVKNYYLRYKLQRTERTMRTEAGPVRRTVVELDNFVLLPVVETMGEPTDRALTEGSEFLTRLSRYNPDEVTVTVWTYPDSYADLRQLKEFLWERGFLAAARPLPAGFPISGSPSGSRSAAE